MKRIEGRIGRLGRLGSLRIIPNLLKFPTLPNLSHFSLLLFALCSFTYCSYYSQISHQINDRARYPLNPQSVVPAIFASAKPRTHPPPKRGLGGGSDLQLPAKQAGVARLSRGNGLFTLQRYLGKKTKGRRNLLPFVFYTIVILRRCNEPRTEHGRST